MKEIISGIIGIGLGSIMTYYLMKNKNEKEINKIYEDLNVFQKRKKENDEQTNNEQTTEEKIIYEGTQENDEEEIFNDEDAFIIKPEDFKAKENYGVMELYYNPELNKFSDGRYEEHDLDAIIDIEEIGENLGIYEDDVLHYEIPMMRKYLEILRTERDDIFNQRNGKEKYYNE